MRDDYQNAIDKNFGVENSQGVEINAIELKRLDSNYTCKDQNWETGKYQGYIYISTPNNTHNLIVAHHNNPSNQEYMLPESIFPGTSGYFTNEDTVSKYFVEDGKFDSVSLGHSLQQAPYYDKEDEWEARLNGNIYYPEYNGHLDCFRVNEDKMLEHFGTTDFYAAMAQCKENTAWGEGGGFQGYNPYANEMINKGALEYVPEKTRTCSNNECLDYAERKRQASEEAKSVNAYIEKNNIQGNPNERLGYNELPQALKKTENASNDSTVANKLSTDKVADGGGSRAPNSSNSDYSPANKGSLDPPNCNAAQGYERASLPDLDSKEQITEDGKKVIEQATVKGKALDPTGKDGFRM